MAQKIAYSVPTLAQDEQLLQEVLNGYRDKSILPEKDEAAKLMLLRVFIKEQLLRLVETEPSISFKKAIISLVSLLPDDSREEDFYLAVAVASSYWPSNSSDFCSHKPNYEQ